MGIFDFLSGSPNVEKLKANNDIEGLISALKSKKDYVRTHAIFALIEIGEPAVEPLIKAHGDVRFQSGVFFVIGNIGDKRAVKHLIYSLFVEDERVHYSAGIALGQIGEPAVDHLIKILEGGYRWEVQKRAAWALGLTRDKRAVEPLILALKDEYFDVRGEAAIALGQIGDKRAVEPLIQAFKDGNKLVQESITGKSEFIWRTAFHERKGIDSGTLRLLNLSLQDKMKAVQDIVKALGELGDARAVEPLTQALEDKMGIHPDVIKTTLEKIKKPH